MEGRSRPRSPAGPRRQAGRQDVLHHEIRQEGLPLLRVLRPGDGRPRHGRPEGSGAPQRRPGPLVVRNAEIACRLRRRDRGDPPLRDSQGIIAEHRSRREVRRHPFGFHRRGRPRDPRMPRGHRGHGRAGLRGVPVGDRIPPQAHGIPERVRRESQAHGQGRSRGRFQDVQGVCRRRRAPGGRQGVFAHPRLLQGLVRAEKSGFYPGGGRGRPP